ncbi:MAG TPA: nucleotidyltransferase domain-containing protein [Acidobacteriota bacterium]|nr:nucleotidyltransferase domain-containing protein [Acidobacteriota bacterium]
MAETRPEVQRVLLFGSFARTDYSARSDIDLLIVLRTLPNPSSQTRPLPG